MMFTFGLLLASGFIVVGLVVTLMCLKGALTDNTRDI